MFVISKRIQETLYQVTFKPLQVSQINGKCNKYRDSLVK